MIVSIVYVAIVITLLLIKDDTQIKHFWEIMASSPNSNNVILGLTIVIFLIMFTLVCFIVLD